MRLGHFSLALHSLWNRKGSAFLTLLAIALSVALVLGVDKARQGAKAGFQSTLSGTHLIVGSRTGQINLLLYSVFRMGDATAEMRWETFEKISNRDDIAWTIPISLGDSHRGFRVLGTNQNYWTHYKYGRNTPLEFAIGDPFDDLFDVVLGADVAQELNYQIGDTLTLAHGIASLPGASSHDNRPFTVTGILARTGTPVDRTVHVSLEAITAIHVGWETGAPSPYVDRISEEMIRDFNLTPRTITAVFVGLENRGSVLRTRREINTNADDPLLAIMPAEALSQLWQITSVAELALLGVSLFVVAVGLVSILVSLLTSLNERRREMSILRAVGAGPWQIFGLLVSESAFLGFVGAVIGVVLINSLLLIAAPYVSAHFGIALEGLGFGSADLYTICVVGALAGLLGVIPATLAFRRSLADGISAQV